MEPFPQKVLRYLAVFCFLKVAYGKRVMVTIEHVSYLKLSVSCVSVTQA